MDPKLAVVIPCYKVENKILEVIKSIPSYIHRIYIVDDCCPNKSGDFVQKHSEDDRIVIIRHLKNKGVGGAVISGYQAAINDEMQIVIKIDGDGQMDPSIINKFLFPILEGEADYTKGNRFYELESVKSMPKIRLFGNAILSFMTKFSTGYWNIFDPTNGYTAINVETLKWLPLNKISERYFFETDMLFRLNTVRAVVNDIPMNAKYENEVSNLKISKITGEFLFKHIQNYFKRIFYNYYLRDLSIASFELPLAIFFTSFGTFFGGYHWYKSTLEKVVSTPGTVMLAALPIIMGTQFLLGFLSQDIRSVPSKPLCRNFKKK